MTGYLATRLGQSLLVLAIMSFLIYSLIGLMPGDPIDMMINADPYMTAEDAAPLRELYGLDLPIYERYWNWLVTALGGDFGYSRLYNQPVVQVLLPALTNSVLLLAVALFVSVTVAIPAGVVAAYRQRSILDYSVNLFAFAGISIPQFWLGLMLIMLFAVILGWLPALRRGAPRWQSSCVISCCPRPPSAWPASAATPATSARPWWKCCVRITSAPRAPRAPARAGLSGDTRCATR